MAVAGVMIKAKKSIRKVVMGCQGHADELTLVADLGQEDQAECVWS